MKITDIKECGSSNLLRWSINNGADIKNDTAIQALINNETFYQLTIEDVNFLELFRLVQQYREKLHVRTEHQASLPPTAELDKLFPGEINQEDVKLKVSEAVEHSCNMFINLAIQMNADDDIIRHETPRLFLPMLSRRFDIDLPISFVDLVAAFQTSDDLKMLFNANYPNNLHDVVMDEENPKIRSMFMLYLFKSVTLIKYDEHYEQLLKLVKYAPLRKCTNDKLYKLRLSGFSKYNNLTRGESRCSLFNITKPEMEKAFTDINKLKTPLKLDFVIQLPIQYMELLANTYTPEELQINFESSISDIVDTGFSFNDFVTPDFEDGDPELDAKITAHENAISAYHDRIQEANNAVISTIPLIVANCKDFDFTTMFAMLPSIYSTKAVITINMEYQDRYLSHFDPLLREMFTEMINIANSIK